MCDYLQAELRQQREDLHTHPQQQQQQLRASSMSEGGADRRHTGKLASSVSSSSAAANSTSSPAGSPVTKRSAARILPSILGRFTSHRSASSDRLKRCSSHRRTESSENIAMSLSSSPGRQSSENITMSLSSSPGTSSPARTSP